MLATNQMKKPMKNYLVRFSHNDQVTGRREVEECELDNLKGNDPFLEAKEYLVSDSGGYADVEILEVLNNYQ
jgi:hypothetical protein